MSPEVDRAELDPLGGPGTFSPDLRASESPIAIACLGLVTLRPLPERNLPSFIEAISRSTFLEAPRLSFLPELALLELDLREPVPLELARLAVFCVAMVLPPSEVGRSFVVDWLSRRSKEACVRAELQPC